MSAVRIAPRSAFVPPPPHRPRDNKGHFISMQCTNPRCGNGTLVYNAAGIWECDGLEDPERDDQELQPCSYWYLDGTELSPPSQGERK